MNKFLILVLILIVSSCSKKPQKRTPITNEGRYAIAQDVAPSLTDFDTGAIEQWDIQIEPKSRYGNHSPYIVFGKTYYLTDTRLDFEQTGTASWYGKKFHGHTTSNMEIFDMYKHTAAHRTLPLPSYVEVTNLENGKKVTVRVNDRGPFKSKRIIDLSWAAAKELEYDKKGLANVHIRLLHPTVKTEPEIHTVKAPDPTNIEALKFLQIGAFAEKTRALEVANQLSKIIFLPVHVTNTLASIPLYRVRIGPLSETENIIDIIQKVNNMGYPHAKMMVE
jgi:rare lipoprotein A